MVHDAVVATVTNATAAKKFIAVFLQNNYA